MIKMVKSLFPSKSERKRRQVWRQFKNACYIMDENGMEVHERHNMFVDCVNEAKARVQAPATNDQEKIKKHFNLNAQYLFVQKALEKYPDWFKGRAL